MRNLRLVAVAIVAVFGLSAVAFAQTSGNQYTVNAKVKVKGGSKKKPKPGGFTLGFDISDPSGNVPQVVKTYFIGGEGLKVTTKVAKGCSASAMDQAQSDSVCPKGSLIGTGEINNYVATAGQPAAGATTCKLPVKIYNGKGTNKAAIWIKTGPPNCIAAVAKSIDAKWVTKSGITGLQFTVPDELRHQLGLDLPVLSVTTTFKKITKKIKGKTVGYFASVGCKDKKRDIKGIFTSEAGATATAKKTLSSC